MTMPADVALGATATLISAVSAGVALFLRGRTRERLAAIQGASEGDRARLVADALPLFDVPTEGLTKEQRYNLVVQQLQDRDRHRSRQSFVAVFAMTLLAVCTIVLSLRDRGAGESHDTIQFNDSPHSTAVDIHGGTATIHAGAPSSVGNQGGGAP